MPTTQQPQTTENDWRSAGSAWGHSACDWAYLFEPYARDSAETIFDFLEVDERADLLDMACGAGYATARAARRNARVTGLDASAELIEIAQRRSPGSDFHIGSMFDLPFADQSFNIVTSFNGIWGGCDAAVAEAFRVLRPGGHIALTFWGPGVALDYRNMFIALGQATPATGNEMIELASIGTPGAAEAMLEDAGFKVVERGGCQSIHEFPDAELMWRSLRSPGLMVPALEALGEDGLRATLMPTVEPFRSSDGSYRIVNELTHVLAIKPTA